jgi:hypothetical protein
MLGTLFAVGLVFGLSVARAYRRQKLAGEDAYRPQGLRWTREPE